MLETACKIADEVNSQQMKITHLELKVQEYEVSKKTNNAEYLKTVNESKRLKETIGKYKAKIVEDSVSRVHLLLATTFILFGNAVISQILSQKLSFD